VAAVNDSSISDWMSAVASVNNSSSSKLACDIQMATGGDRKRVSKVKV
jgi:hypothetical protein